MVKKDMKNLDHNVIEKSLSSISKILNAEIYAWLVPAEEVKCELSSLSLPKLR